MKRKIIKILTTTLFFAKKLSKTQSLLLFTYYNIMSTINPDYYTDVYKRQVVM